MTNNWRIVLMVIAMGAYSLSGQAQQTGESEVTISEKTYDDWTVRCQQAKGEEKSCVMTQRTFVEDSGQRLMQVNVMRVPEQEQPVMILVLPLGVSLAAGVNLQLGEEGDEEEENANRMGYSHCDQNACYVNILLTDEAKEDITAVDAGTITFTTLQGQAIDVPFSSKGFDDALESFSESSE